MEGKGWAQVVVRRGGPHGLVPEAAWVISAVSPEVSKLHGAWLPSLLPLFLGEFLWLLTEVMWLGR